MRNRLGFYSLVLIVALLGAIGLGVLGPNAPGSGRVTSAFAKADNGDNGSGDNSAADNAEDNADNDDSVTAASNTPTPTPVPPQETQQVVVVQPPVVVIGPGNCVFVLGFQFLHSILGANGINDGGCVDNERPNPVNGDSLQRTALGLMVYQKSTNTMRWTDGYRTYTYSGCGLQERLNTQSFSWEIGGGSCDLAVGPGYGETSS